MSIDDLSSYPPFRHNLICELPGDNGLVVADRSAPIPTIERKDLVVEKTLSHQKWGREYQCLTLVKGDPHYDAALQSTKDFVDKNTTVTDAGNKTFE